MIVSDVKEIQQIRNEIDALGCESEVNLKVKMIAFEVPASTNIYPVLDYIVAGKESGKLDYEEAALRHKL